MAANPPGPAPQAPGAPPQPAAPTPAVASAAEIETYKAFATLVNAEEQVFWTRNNLFQLLHVALFAGLATLLAEAHKSLFDCDPTDLVPNVFPVYWLALLGVCVIGLASGVSWLLMIWRSVYIMDSASDRLQAIEAQLHGTTGPFRAYTLWRRDLEQPGHGVARRKRARLSQIWAGLALVFIAVWLAAAVLVASQEPTLSAACLPDTRAPAESAGFSARN